VPHGRSPGELIATSDRESERVATSRKDVRKAFVDKNPAAAGLFAPRQDGSISSISRLARQRSQTAVWPMSMRRICTASEEPFFSVRRDRTTAEWRPFLLGRLEHADDRMDLRGDPTGRCISMRIARCCALSPATGPALGVSPVGLFSGAVFLENPPRDGTPAISGAVATVSRDPGFFVLESSCVAACT